MTSFLVFNPQQARTASAIFDCLFPADDYSLSASDIGVAEYVDRALAGACSGDVETYRLGLAALNQASVRICGQPFADARLSIQHDLIAALEQDNLPEMRSPAPRVFFDLLRAHLQEGLFADPMYGGNRDKQGWKFLGHPGVWLENSAEENLTSDPVTKNGMIQSLRDLGYDTQQPEIAGYDPQRGTLPPVGPADVVLVGLGAVGGVVAPVLAKAGLKVVALEAGPWRTKQDFLPDELGAAYYCRANMGAKFLSEAPRWRPGPDLPTQPATFSLGRMMNGVGGSVVHYGAWLRRFHPHHFRSRSRVREWWGDDALPEDCTLADWLVSYDDLEPYYTRLEHEIGVAGDEGNPFIKRSQPLPMPPLRPFRMGEFFREAAESMGLHPHAVPVGMNSVPYDGRPATTYTAWSNGFGSFADDKWHPALSSVPEALATGNLDLRTHCRVIRVLTDKDGHASGVEYIGANGERYAQEARTVILCSYTYENIRLLLLSGSAKHPNGLGNNAGQVGQHYMTKMFAHVDGFFPDVIFNRHTGPAAQGVVLDDFLAEDFDSLAHGFIGGATLGAEQQFLPIQISREALPPDVPLWGQGYKDHLRQWQHFGVVRIQPDMLPYRSSYLDLDPHYRDRSGLGMPVMRITYNMRENERRLAMWMEEKAAEILRRMGAVRTWAGPHFTGVGSSHDLGGCRMGDDPGVSVVDGDLRVHDTPGLYVFGGAAFPSCPGINPTLTIWAVCLRAAERLVEYLQGS
jgi:gluconate 2-dehydrogenase alpha chain